MDEICLHTLTRLTELVDQGALTAEEVVEAAVDRAAVVDGATNAFVAMRPVADAPRPDSRLRGLPIAVKDQFVDRGRAPTCGSRVAATWLSGTADVFDELREGGATVIAYTNMHEWGVGTTSEITATGPIRNPWDLGRVAGGSSGGSAAAVAAGAVPAAVGTDAGGSVRVPAACCRMVGFKPTQGHIPRVGFVGDGNPIDHVGVLARSVQDVGAMYEVLSGRRRNRSVTATNIGVAAGLFDQAQPGIRAAIHEALGALPPGCRLSEVELSGVENSAAAVATMLFSFIAETWGPDLNTRLQELRPETAALIALGGEMTSADRQRAEDAVRQARHAFDEVFRRVDLVVTPTLAAGPPPVGTPLVELPDGPTHFDLSNVAFNSPMNLAGVPSLSVPCGRSEDWTVNLTVTGPRDQDQMVLEFAAMIEKATDRSFVNAVAAL